MEPTVTSQRRFLLTGGASHYVAILKATGDRLIRLDSESAGERT
jgi:hypothetical protein